MDSARLRPVPDRRLLVATIEQFIHLGSTKFELGKTV
jgi:hypothetical protein